MLSAIPLRSIRDIFDRYSFADIVREVVDDPLNAMRAVLTPPAHMYQKERRIPEHELTTFLGALSEGSNTATHIALSESVHESGFDEDIRHAFGRTDYRPNELHENWRNAVYVFVRLKKPTLVVESGVYDGLASAYILQALEDNGHGKLISVDINETEMYPSDLPDPNAGWLVPERLRDRWDLHYADARKFLKNDIELSDADIFFVDTPDEITYHHVRLAAEHIESGGTMLASHPEPLLFGNIDGFDVDYRYGFLDKGAGTLNGAIFQEE